MAYGGYSYIDEKYVPERDDFVTVLWVKGKAPFETLAEGLASESSIGTWTKLATMNDFVWEKLRARIFRLKRTSSSSGFVFIAYPYEHFDSRNLLQILASIRGNIYGLKELEECKLLDWTIPEKFQKQFPGPKMGLAEIRKHMGTKNRPHVGTIVKPKVGLSPREWANVAAKAFLGGLDMVKDDENLVDQKFCPWETRVANVIEAAERGGEPKIYVPNISDSLPMMLERIDFLVEHGWKMAMIDAYVMGLAGLQEVLKELHKKKFLVHAHRAGHGAETRGPWGVGFAFWEKLYRLLGVSSLHTGTGVGKMEGGALEVGKYGEIAKEKRVGPLEPFFLEFKWAPHVKPVMPVASGGNHPGLMEGIIKIYGRDVTVMAGGGVHGHAGGTVAGAKALRDAADAVAQGKTLVEKANESPELKAALEKWSYLPGIKTGKKIKDSQRNFQKNRWKFGWNLDRVVE